MPEYMYLFIFFVYNEQFQCNLRNFIYFILFVIFGNQKIIVSEDFIVSDDDEWQSDRSSPKPRRKRGKRRGGNDSGSDWEVEHKKTKKPAHKFGSGSESGSDWGSAKKKKVSFTLIC